MILRFSINYFIFFAIVATVVPYLQQLLKFQGFRPYEIGLLLGIFEITGVLGPLLVGWLADKINRYRLILLVLSVGSGLSFLFLMFNNNFAAVSMILIIFGLMHRPIASLTDALASRSLTDAVKQYGSARIWGSVGFVAISFLYQIWGFLDSSSPVNIVIVFLVLSGGLFLSNLSLPEVKRFPQKTESVPSDIRGQKANPFKVFTELPAPFWIGIAVAFIIKMGMSGYYSFFSIYLKEVYGMKGVSAVWGIGALAEIPVVLWGSRFVVRYGVSRMLIVAAAGTVIRMVLYAVAPPVPIIIMAQTLHALSFGLLHITIIVLINHIVAKESRAIAMAVFGGISYGLAGFIGSSLCGLILEARGFTVMYLICGAAIMVAVFIASAFRKLLD